MPFTWFKSFLKWIQRILGNWCLFSFYNPEFRNMFGSAKECEVNGWGLNALPQSCAALDNAEPDKGVPGGSAVKNPPAKQWSCKRHGFDPWVEKILWRRAWQPSPVFLPGKSHGQRSLAGYGPRSPKGETEATKHAHTSLLKCIWTKWGWSAEIQTKWHVDILQPFA